MNYQQRQALEEDSPAMADTIFKQASSRARQDQRYRPITLELADQSKERHILTGADTFSLTQESVGQNTGRLRNRLTVHIVDKSANFIDHPDFVGLMLHIPSTERNMKLLATHYPGQRWTIHQEDIDARVAENAKKVQIVRDDAYEAQPPEFKDLESETDKLKREKESLEAKQKELEKQLAEVRKSIGQNLPEQEAAAKDPKPEPKPVEPVQAKQADEPSPLEWFRGLDGDHKKKVQLTIYEKHQEEIDKMKADGTKRIDLTKEFQEWVREEMRDVHTVANA